MPTAVALSVDLSGIARLAGVKRPVVSMWRKRFASGSDPFPAALDERSGRPVFDAVAVAEWLTRTEHGNNREAVADAAASAAPNGFDFADATHVATVDALLALRAASGSPVGGAPQGLRERAMAVDPEDQCLITEVAGADGAWAEWADLLADAAYSPLEASRLLELRHRATLSSSGSSGPLASDAEALLVALVQALRADRAAQLAIGPGITASLISELLSQIGDDIDLVAPSTDGGRAIRRRILCDRVALPAEPPLSEAPRLQILRVPHRDATALHAMLEVVDEVVLGMRDQDRAVVLGPASVLIDSLPRVEDAVRTDALRSGRVRAIVRLPRGLVTAAPREALALWVLGREAGDTPIADRVTAVADLADSALTAASRADLVSDVLASMSGARAARAHAFRFARSASTASLLASGNPLVSRTRTSGTASSVESDLPALLDQARADLGAEAPDIDLTPVEPDSAAPGALVEELMEQRLLRVIAGTRVRHDEFAERGLVVISAEDLDDPASIGRRRVDPLMFAMQHPSARLTSAGDVVFRSGPTAKAWVDLDGSKVVAHPARVLRINAVKRGGLVPEIVAADINVSIAGPAAWRRWQLRRVDPGSTASLRAALSDIANHRAALARRIEALDTYEALLIAGVVSGAVTLNDHAATAASEN